MQSTGIVSVFDWRGTISINLSAYLVFWMELTQMKPSSNDDIRFFGRKTATQMPNGLKLNRDTNRFAGMNEWMRVWMSERDGYRKAIPSMMAWSTAFVNASRPHSGWACWIWVVAERFSAFPWGFSYNFLFSPFSRPFWHSKASKRNFSRNEPRNQVKQKLNSSSRIKARK